MPQTLPQTDASGLQTRLLARLGRGLLVALLLAASLVLTTASPASSAGGVSGDGSSSSQAGPSCWGIKQDHPGSTDGIYWLYLPELGAPQQFYCDMTTDGGGWLLVGRGRESWSFQPDGQGSPYYVYADPTGFTPAFLSGELVDTMLGGVPASQQPDGVRIRRAANPAGTAWQEIRMDLADQVTDWSWGFGGGLEVEGIEIDGTTYGTTNTADTIGSWYDIPSSLSGLNDERRMVTKLWSAFGWRMGFAYGGATCGATTSPTNYFYDARGNGCNAMPFTQVWVRPRIAETDVSYTALGSTALPAETNTPVLDSDPLTTSWGVQGIADFQYWNRHEVEVWAFAEIGDRVFVGGKFAQVVDGPNGDPINQPYLAAFDRDTGAHLPGFAPDVEGPVYDLDVTADGRLIVAGEFFDIDGETGTSGLAALDPVTGAVDQTWISSLKRIDANDRPLVNDLDVQGNWVYAVGDFDLAERKNGEPDFRVWRLGRFHATTGEVDWNWRPKADFEVVSVDAVSGEAHFAGKFSAINQSPDTYVKGTVNLVDGATITSYLPHETSTNNGQIYQQAMIELADGSQAWLGGSEHDLQLLDGADHELLYSHITKPGGDFQTIAEVDGLVYAACHCNQWNYSGTNSWPSPSNYDRVDKANYLMAFDAHTGRIDTRFFPDFYVGSYFEGPWDLFEDSRGCLWVGGDLARGAWNGAGYDWLGGFGVLCPTDVTAPNTPTGFSVTTNVDGDNVLGWQHATDDDGAAVQYEIWKDDRVIRTQSGRFWTDTDVTGAHTYAVRSVDTAGNQSSTTVPVAIAPPEPPGELVLDGDTVWSYRDDLTTLPTDWPLPDTTGWPTGTGHFGFGDGDEDTVIGGSGLVQYFSTTFDLPSPTHLQPVRLRVRRDDGIVVWVNGTEFFRDNVPAGPVTGSTASSSYKWGAAEDEWLTMDLPPLAGQTGNVISVSLHQGHAGNSDASFELQLESLPDPGGATPPSIPDATVTNVTETSATVSWTPSTDDVEVLGYHVWLEGDEVRSVFVPADQTSYELLGLAPASDFTVTVEAYDGDNEYSTEGPIPFSTAGDPITFSFGSTWSHDYGNGAPPADWTTPAFDDAAWPSGPGQLGFGDGDEATVIGTSGHLVAYFRSTFEVADVGQVVQIRGDLVRDDGAVIYVNGNEVARSNMPSGPIGHSSYATAHQWGAAESTPVSFTIPASALVTGTNTIAVSVHQTYAGSPDLSFDLQLTEERP